MLRTLSLISLLAIGSCAPAFAAPVVCGERSAFTAALKNKFKEERRAIGLVATTSVVELYVSQGGSWTILMTGTDGKACVLATGHSWEQMLPKAGGQES